MFLIIESSSGARRKKSGPDVPDNISLETPEQYVDRMIENIRYYMDIGYYSEALYFLSDLKETNEKGLCLETIAELEKELNSLYSPEKENSVYNSDVLRCVKDFTGKYGYIDQNGEFVIPAKFDRAYEFSEGLALVIQDDERFFINRKGETVICFKPEEKMEIRTGFSSGLALCYYNGEDTEKGNGFVYIDKQRKTRLFLPNDNRYQARYEPYGFSEGYAVVEDKKKNLCGYIDTDGKWLVEPTFKNAYAFRNGMAAVVYPNTDVNLKGIDIESEEKPAKKWTPLMYAVAYDQLETAKLLLIQGEARSSEKDEENKNALMIACEKGNAPMVGLLMDPGASITSWDKDGWTPLMYAAKNGRVEVIKLMIERYPKQNLNRTNNKNETALAIAIAHNQTEVVEILKAAGAK